MDHVLSLTDPFPGHRHQHQGHGRPHEALKRHNRPRASSTRGRGASTAPRTRCPSPRTRPRTRAASTRSRTSRQPRSSRCTRKSTGSAVTILRLSTSTGRGHRCATRATAWSTGSCDSRLTACTIPVFGDGTILRDFLYVDDCVEAILLAAASRRGPRRGPNVGGGRADNIPRGRRDVAALTGGALGVRAILPRAEGAGARRLRTPTSRRCGGSSAGGPGRRSAEGLGEDARLLSRAPGALLVGLTTFSFTGEQPARSALRRSRSRRSRAGEGLRAPATSGRPRRTGTIGRSLGSQSTSAATAGARRSASGQLFADFRARRAVAARSAGVSSSSPKSSDTAAPLLRLASAIAYSVQFGSGTPRRSSSKRRSTSMKRSPARATCRRASGASAPSGTESARAAA